MPRMALIIRPMKTGRLSASPKGLSRATDREGGPGWPGKVSSAPSGGLKIGPPSPAEAGYGEASRAKPSFGMNRMRTKIGRSF
jgi:hypothetical protein